MKRCKNCNSIISDPDPITTYPVIFCPWPDCQSAELETIPDDFPWSVEETDPTRIAPHDKWQPPPSEYTDALPWSDQWPEKHETASRCNCCGQEPGEPHICPTHDNGEWNDWNCTCNCCPGCVAAGKCGAL